VSLQPGGFPPGSTPSTIPSVSTSPSMTDVSPRQPSNAPSASSAPTSTAQKFTIATTTTTTSLAATLAGTSGARQGASVLITNATFIGCSLENQTAVYTGGVRLGLSDGVVLSTGHVSHLLGVVSTSCKGEGYAALDALASGYDSQRLHHTIDAAVLVIEFDCAMESDYYEVTLDYHFASNEYSGLAVNESVMFNDVAGIFFNGEASTDNIATVGGKVVSVDNVRGSYYRPYSEGKGPPHVYGGSVPLKAMGRSTTKSNVIRIAVADQIDKTRNSYLFIDKGSLKCKTVDKATMPSSSPSVVPTQPLLSDQPAQSPSTTMAQRQGFQLSSGTVRELAEKIAGPSVTIISASLIREACNGTSASLFSGGTESITLDDGVVLSSGHAS
jgi:hypothetical protein